MNLLLNASDAADAPPALLGGKALGLTRLNALPDVEVPPFVVLPATSGLSHLAHAQALATALHFFSGPYLRLAITPDDHTALHTFSNQIRQQILSAPLPHDLDQLLQDPTNLPGPGPFAVRSSMVGEDGQSQSYAGQLESFLYCQSHDEIARAIKQCWASAFSPRALIYRLRAKLQDLSPGADPLSLEIPLPRVAVILQQMITGQVSGVLFTAHPTTGNPSHALITANYGLAEGVVNGSCNTDEFTLSTGSFEILNRTIAPKDLQILPHPDGTGTIEAPVDPDLQHTPALPDDMLQRIARTAHQIATHLGAPQDIEWTLADHTLYILQTRPITALPTPPNTDGPRQVFNNSNIQESYCGVTTPLTFSFAQAAYASVYRQTMQALRIPQHVIDDHRDMLRNMLGLIRGRIYYNINNWYRGLLLLPSFGRNKEDMEAMMGLDVEVDFVEDQTLSTSEKLRRLPRVLNALFWLLLGFKRLDKNIPAFLQKFETSYQRIDRSRFEDATFSELMDTIDQIHADMIEDWTTPIINDFYVMIAMGKLRRLVQSTAHPDHEELLINLLSGEEGIESVEPTRVLMRLARKADKDPALKALFDHPDPLHTIAAIRRHHPHFSALLDDYIERYGDRVIGELKLETITARKDPSYLIKIIANYLKRPDLDPNTLARREKDLRHDAEQTLFKALSPFQRRKARKILLNARQSVKNRENLRLARTRMFGLIRDAYTALGHRLVEAHRLRHPRDIFFLTTDELLAYHEGRAVTSDLQPLVDTRKAEFERYQSLDVPHHFETRGPVYHGNAFQGPQSSLPVDPNAELLQGTGCFPGHVRAPLRVILSPDDNLDLDGHILTTLRTDPGWAPLFPAAAGILVERGSTLSHSAVVARELGIPAVVGVPNLLATVHDGEIVLLDGKTGLVQRHL